MPSRKQKKANNGASAETAKASAETAEASSTSTTPSAAKKQARKSARRKLAKRRGPGRPKGSKNKPAATRKAAMRTNARSRRYTPAERSRILAAAKREGLSGAAAAKKFGISQLTFYTWRKKAGVRGRRGRRAAAVGEVAGRTLANALNIADVLRTEIRAQIRRLIPEVVAAELGGQGMRRRGRRAKS